MTDVFLTVTQSLYMVAIAPCVLILLHLLIFTPRTSLIILPVGYFSVMIISLLVSLVPLLAQTEHGNFTPLWFLWAEGFLPFLSFLLITQFLYGRIPPKVYWLVLLIPCIELPPFMYAFLVSDQVCLTDICVSSQKVFLLNNIVMGACIFMFLTSLLSRTPLSLKQDDMIMRNRYWMVVALIILNLLFLALDLLLVQDYLDIKGYELAKLLVKIIFIYLMLSSLFKVFSATTVNTEKTTSHNAPLTPPEHDLAKAIIAEYETKYVYRDMEFNRLQLAEGLKLSEHQLSRIINKSFNKSFSELTNHYRIKDASRRLRESADSITVIAFDTGFSSITSFNRVFKAKVGMSPSDYRKRHQ